MRFGGFALLVPALVVAFALAACGGEGDASPAQPDASTAQPAAEPAPEPEPEPAPPVAEPAPEPEPASEPPPPTEPTEPEPESSPGDPENGAIVFASAGCGDCHSLAAAGATGNYGGVEGQPNPQMDFDIRSFGGSECEDVDFDYTVTYVSFGNFAMPAYLTDGLLTEDEIRDVAAYLVEAVPTCEELAATE